MITFKSIFDGALPLFDDPDIRSASINDPVAYEKMMLPFLMDAVSSFIMPSVIASKLYSTSEPQGQSESFAGTGAATYDLSISPVDGAVFSYYVDGSPITGASYDAAANKVTFPSVIATTSTASVAWYFAGAFTADFTGCFRSDIDINVVMSMTTNILAHKLVAAWDYNEMNRALDIRNIPTDTDFKISSPANSAKAKVEHHRQGVLNEEDRLTSALGWYIQAMPQGGYRFGQ